jgi:hypothetical protein
MAANAVEVQGILREDGTLVLDEKPNLPPGRVEVVLHPTAEPVRPADDWWQFMQQARRDLETSGAHFLNAEEVETHLDWLRERDWVDDLLGDADTERAGPERP